MLIISIVMILVILFTTGLYRYACENENDERVQMKISKILYNEVKLFAFLWIVYGIAMMIKHIFGF